MTEHDWLDFEEDMCVFVNMYEGKSYEDARDAAREEIKELRGISSSGERSRIETEGYDGEIDAKINRLTNVELLELLDLLGASE